MAKKYNFDFMDAKAGDSLFGKKDASGEKISPENIKNKIVDIDINKLKDYHNHTFKVKEDADMEELVSSIKDNGVITPLTVRESDKGTYEIIAGHRRKFASKKAGLKEVPCVVLSLSDEEADILMVDSNFQREHILPSEKAFSYKVKMDALKRQGKRTDLTDEDSKNSIDIVSQDSGDSKSKIQRYIRLTYLVPELLELVDKDYLKMSAGVLISYATKPAQNACLEAMSEKGRALSIAEAEKVRALSVNKKKVSKEGVLEIMGGGAKKEGEPKIKFNESAFKDFLPKKVAKLPIEKRVSYHRRALEVYAAYVNEHPEELDNL